jgi:hypothetical protein
VRTNESQENSIVLWDIQEQRLRALSPYGPVRAGLTTLPSQRIVREENEARLMELLNSLESVVHDLNYKSFTLYDTLNTAIEAVRVALLRSTIEEGGTDTL